MNINKLLKNIKDASFELSQMGKTEKNRFLGNLSKLLWINRRNILSANKRDRDEAIDHNLSESFIERLVLDEKKLKQMIHSIQEISLMESTTGKILEKRILENGLILKKISVPIGVILVIYESRPEVTIDVAALCIKSGNCVILKGGKESLHTNKALYDCIKQALKATKLQKESIIFIRERDILELLLKQNKYIDLVIARGGYEMVKKIRDISKIPVLSHSAGGSRIYVDKSADLKIAKNVVINSKISKPAACNSVDTILVHKSIAGRFIQDIWREFVRLGVDILGDEETARIVHVEKASVSDWKKEFLTLKVNIKVVDNLDHVVHFVHKYGKGHSEGIIARDERIINKFIREIDCAGIFVNCSTRLHDGCIFGMGAELGISTGKFHARGPVGMDGLTSYKWTVYGTGQLRE